MSCFNIDEDLGRSVIGALSLELGPLGRGGLRSGRDLGCRRRLWDGRIFRTEADFRKVGWADMDLDLDVFRIEDSPEKVRSGGGSGMNSETCGCLRKSSW